MAASVARARERASPGAWDAAKRAFVFDNFLILLRTAVARWHRGERLSARRYLEQFAVDALLGLALEHSPAAAASERDPVDPRRRIERQQRHLAAAVEGEREIAVRARLTRSSRLREAVSQAYAGKYHTPASKKWVDGFAEPLREKNTLELTPL